MKIRILTPALALALFSGCTEAEPTAFTAGPEPGPVAFAPAEPTPDPVAALSELPTPVQPRTLLEEIAIPHHDAKYHDHLEEALMLREEGQPGKAIDALRRALFDAPESAVTWMTLAESYVDVGRAGRAEECARQALVHEPRLADAHRHLARRLLDQGDAVAARPHATMLAGIRRDDAEAAHLLGRTYVALSMWEEAIDQNRRAVAADPKNIHAYNNLGFAALQIGRTGIAVQYLEAALELEGLEPYMLNNLGIAYERSGRDIDALSVYAKAVELDPTYVKGRTNRDRVRDVVDARIADEVSAILAAQGRERTGADGTPTAALLTAPEAPAPVE